MLNMFEYGILNLKQALAQKWIRGGNDGRNNIYDNDDTYAQRDIRNDRRQTDNALQEGKQAVERGHV